MAFTGCASKSIDASCLMANVPEESLDFIANRAGEGGIAFDSGKWISELGIMSPEHPADAITSLHPSAPKPTALRTVGAGFEDMQQN
jgi:hypothetical protein